MSFVNLHIVVPAWPHWVQFSAKAIQWDHWTSYWSPWIQVHYVPFSSRNNFVQNRDQMKSHFTSRFVVSGIQLIFKRLTIEKRRWRSLEKVACLLTASRLVMNHLPMQLSLPPFIPEPCVACAFARFLEPSARMKHPIPGSFLELSRSYSVSCRCNCTVNCIFTSEKQLQLLHRCYLTTYLSSWHFTRPHHLYRWCGPPVLAVLNLNSPHETILVTFGADVLLPFTFCTLPPVSIAQVGRNWCISCEFWASGIFVRLQVEN